MAGPLGHVALDDPAETLLDDVESDSQERRRAPQPRPGALRLRSVVATTAAATLLGAAVACGLRAFARPRGPDADAAQADFISAVGTHEDPADFEDPCSLESQGKATKGSKRKCSRSDKATPGGKTTKPAWWFLYGVRPLGEEKEMGSMSVITFSKEQQTKFGVDEMGEVVDKALFDKVLKELDEEAKERKKSVKPAKPGKAPPKVGQAPPSKTDAPSEPVPPKAKGGKPKSKPTSPKVSSKSTTTTPQPCAYQGEDCSEKECCATAGMQCYEKNEGFAMCRAECIPGAVDPADMDSGNWTCKEIGERAKGEIPECSDGGEECGDTGCCNEVGHTCFQKNKTFAMCKAVCNEGAADVSFEDWETWSCEPLGPKKQGVSPWVLDFCANSDEDCSESRCCQESGELCYEKGEFWAQCKPECQKEPPPDQEWEGPWTCKELGYRTPNWEPDANMGPPVGSKMAPWVKDKCVDGYDDCSKVGCCLRPGFQCFMKNEYWGMCEEECEGENATGDEKWSCEKVGERSWGLAVKGWPPLYCYAVLRVDGYEPKLMRKQFEAGAGIFACDGYDMVANGVIEIGDKDTLEIPSIEVGTSQDGTAANTLLFMKVWDAVIKKNDFVFYDWVIKVDPDAVLMPDRVRVHVAPYSGPEEKRGLYFVNCNAYPEAPTFPMMYGSLEVYNRQAIVTYAEENLDKCQTLDWKLWGEDFYMTRCMDQLEVQRVEDFRIIGDNTCVGPGQSGANCEDSDVAAFHPYKEIEDWIGCFKTATGITLTAEVEVDDPKADKAEAVLSDAADDNEKGGNDGSQKGGQ